MPELTLYFDRNIGKKLPELVALLKPPFQVRSHFMENFKHDMPDDEWLAIIGRKGWIVISHDGKWHREEAPLAAIKQHKIPCFYLWGAQIPIWEKISLLSKVYPKIRKTVASEKKPFIYRFNQNGRQCLIRHWDGRDEPKIHSKSTKHKDG